MIPATALARSLQRCRRPRVLQLEGVSDPFPPTCARCRRNASGSRAPSWRGAPPAVPRRARRRPGRTANRELAGLLPAPHGEGTAICWWNMTWASCWAPATGSWSWTPARSSPGDTRHIRGTDPRHRRLPRSSSSAHDDRQTAQAAERTTGKPLSSVLDRDGLTRLQRRAGGPRRALDRAPRRGGRAARGQRGRQDHDAAHVCGMLKPIAGRLRPSGADLTAPPLQPARQGIALVTEERAVFLGLTVAEHLNLEPAAAARPDGAHRSSRPPGSAAAAPACSLAASSRCSPWPGAGARAEAAAGLDELSWASRPSSFSAFCRRCAPPRRTTNASACFSSSSTSSRPCATADRGHVLAHGVTALEGEADHLRTNHDLLISSYFGEHTALFAGTEP